MQSSKTSLQLSVNGQQYTLDVDPETPLLYVLRNQLQKNGPKYGCGYGQCGACMVLLDNQAVMSCLLPVSAVTDKEIVTIDGLAAIDGSLHPIQQAFIDEQAAQCGYCTNGMIMASVALLTRSKDAGEEEIRQALQTNLCRCGTQSRVLRAVKQAQESMQ
ncbi:(2Fe-2S)-binding protein [Flavilitoribacter nigricans]|uniref:(2Fe-2S)-binding protein n=1 Tax=Flavilitoribacter nigricans (strain ATCC 23147 / DSM 23189 / NBRC 102662 / NCIMB 1420 / SS-2) TaxID=1122177 RepID=A0A2D0N3P3_FLAN2|nr:(2Fe-2S)-binding protein [Flavilitoribacter nigricans]PHN03124.1 (2Fe-2S)-binding protein [Flavilitoribacter nigricans DSM 23189 = NBRC 102662]